jgi:hypothetical protein
MLVSDRYIDAKNINVANCVITDKTNPDRFSDVGK